MAVATVEAVAGPDPEARPARQVYPATDKLKVLDELDAADSKSERGEILRRQGLYWSVVSERRKQRDRGALEATLLDEGTSLCSERQMYRVLAERGLVRERRRIAHHRRGACGVPRLEADRPNVG